MNRGLTERSGAHISLQDREYPIVNDDRVLRLSGMPEQIAAARQEILDLIAKAPPIEGTHHPDACAILRLVFTVHLRTTCQLRTFGGCGRQDCLVF